jgi:hypothetical protein
MKSEKETHIYVYFPFYMIITLKAALGGGGKQNEL